MTTAYPGLPMPQQVSATAGAGFARGKSSLRFIGPEDSTLRGRFNALLADAQLGVVQVDVVQVCEGVPQQGIDESSTLQCGSDGIKINAAQTWGGLHALTTLRQLYDNGSLDTNAWHISDAPRFAWRGLCLDVARHFYSVNALERVLDGMSILKLNVLHLHLTDDQAFRFGSVEFENLADAQHYSHDELRGLVKYAAARGVRVVPELDVPGHATSWLINYPQWGVDTASATERFGVHKASLDVTQEEIYDVMQKLFAELASVFPDDYVHIGGDEVNPSWWRESEHVQQHIAAHDLEDEQGLQAYFNRRLVGLLADLGKKPMGWDEVLHEQMPDMLVQNWRGATTRDRARVRGLDCLVSAGYYVDLFYPADMHYRYDPEMPQQALVALEDEFRADERLQHVSEGIAWTEQWRKQAVEGQELKGSVIGGEACMWSELVDEATLPVRLWSRLPAIAERLWSPVDVTDVDNFYERLDRQLGREPFNTVAAQHASLVGLGLSAQQCDVAMMLEPVKWYARLLGQQALQARLQGSEMPQARPYQVSTPLDKVIDLISPESLSARSIRKMSDNELKVLANNWRQLRAESWSSDIGAAIRGLAQLGAALHAALTGELAESDLQGALQRLYVPHGEYMLAPIPWLRQRLLQGSS